MSSCLDCGGSECVCSLRGRLSDAQTKVSTLMAALRGEQGILLDDGTVLHPGARIQELERHLRKYGRHFPSCPHWLSLGKAMCDCGWDMIRKKI